MDKNIGFVTSFVASDVDDVNNMVYAKAKTRQDIVLLFANSVCHFFVDEQNGDEENRRRFFGYFLEILKDCYDAHEKFHKENKEN